MAAPAIDPKIIKAFEEYLSSRKVLIADPNRSSRTGIARTLSEMGARTSNITMCDNFDEALEAVKTIKPEIIVADYDFGKAGGLTLIQEQRLHQMGNKLSLAMIITGNTSQSAVAQAAEEDVDTFILKPYTVEGLKKGIMNAAIMKLFPSNYLKTIASGKELLHSGKPAEALAIFIEAKKLDTKPTLACFYAGQAELMKKAMEEAGGNYKDGLTYNKIHYKCLVGLFDMLMERKAYQEAYDCMKKVAQYFPANPNRLASVIRLAVMTKSVEDMERYYQIFIGLDTRSPELTKYICAGLIVCGKYYIKTKNNSRALDLFRKAAVSGAGNVKFLREIISTLIEYKMTKDASEFLGRFPADLRKGTDFLTCQYMIASAESPPSLVVESGRNLLKADVHEPMIYECLIKASLKVKLTDYAETLLLESKKRWPADEAATQAMYDAELKKLATAS